MQLQAKIAFLAALVIGGAMPLAAMPLQQAALPPGKPAGIRTAQASPEYAIFVGAAAVIAGLGLYLAKGTYNLPGQPSGAANNPQAATGTP